MPLSSSCVCACVCVCVLRLLPGISIAKIDATLMFQCVCVCVCVCVYVCVLRLLQDICVTIINSTLNFLCVFRLLLGIIVNSNESNFVLCVCVSVCRKIIAWY